LGEPKRLDVIGDLHGFFGHVNEFGTRLCGAECD
jgi:hypothetical protein